LAAGRIRGLGRLTGRPELTRVIAARRFLRRAVEPTRPPCS